MQIETALMHWVFDCVFCNVYVTHSHWYSDASVADNAASHYSHTPIECAAS